MTSYQDLVAFEPELRRLALRLMADPQQAEEALQETYLVALDSRPDQDRGANGWLRRILRSKARQLALRERRRLRLERSLPPLLSDPSSEESRREQRALLHRLALELEGLREPYRSTLRERFLDGVSPLDIARREGIPVRTIHTRITRGLALLRAALERGAGRRDARLVVLLGAWRRLPTRWVAALVVAACAVWTLEVVPPRARAGSGAAVALQGVALAGGGARSVQPVTPLLREERSPEATTPVASEPAALGAAPVAAAEGLAGRVVDLDGLGVGGLEVVFEAGRLDAGPLTRLDFRFVPDGRTLASTRSAGDGAFRIERPPDERGRIVARGPQHRTVVAELFHGFADGAPLEIVVAPHAPLAGRVLDESGDAVEDALVVLRPAEGFLAGLIASPHSTLPTVIETRSASDGSFRIEDAYRMRAARLEVRARGFEERRIVLEEVDVLDVILAAERAHATGLRGTLCDLAGAPVAGRIAAAGRLVDADQAGRFELDVAGLATGETVWGFVPGRMPARWSLDPAVREVVLQVGEPAARISGRVEDDQGRPVGGAFVWTIDPTLLGPDLSAFFAETHMNEDPRANIPFQVQCDEHGRFDLPYLLARAYRLGALERETMVATQSPPIPAGARDVVLRLPSSVVRTPVLGRIVDRHGTPVANARVGVHRAMVEVSDRDGRRLTSSFRGPVRASDEDGWFGLPPVPEEGCFLDVMAEGCFSTMFPLPRGSARDYVELTLARSVPLEVSWSEHAGALTHFGVVGPTGARLDLLPASVLDTSQGVLPQARAQLVRGTSSLVLAPDSATALVLFAGEHEVERRPLAWVPSGTTRVEL